MRRSSGERWLHQECQVVERHLFIGLAQKPGGGRSGLAPGFEKAMRMAGVKWHYLNRSRWGEKGVDTALALEVQGLIASRRIEIAVLVATDGDFVPLAKSVRKAGGRFVVVALHLPHIRPRPLILSPELTDAADLVIPLTELIERGSGVWDFLVDGLFWRPGASPN
jgi:uncharacterized LabA/DUF88 family protein